MKRFTKKIILSFLLFFFTFFSFTTKTMAQTGQEISPWYNQGFKEWYIKVYDESNPTEIFGERYTATQVQWVLYGVLSFIMNQTGDPALYKCLITEGNNIANCTDAIKNAVDKLISFNDNLNKNAIAQTTSRPISFISYLQNLSSRFSIVKETKAQTTSGFGFGAISSVQGLWQITRNLSYFLIIIVVIAFSLMIMFRVKISPQAVITVQSALPKIVITLILITFSYAIAGFLVDLMYVVIGIISFLFAGKISSFSVQDLFKALTTDRSIFSIMVYYFFTFALAAFSAFSSGWAGIFAGPIMSMLAIITIIVAIIVLFVTYFRILWLLIKTYVNIILEVVTGPIKILIGAVSPGAGGFSKWLKNMLANLVVYPTVGLMFLLSFLFLRGVFDSFTILGLQVTSIPAVDNLLTYLMPFKIRGGFLGTNAWNAPLTAGEKAVAIIYLFVSFAIVTMIPKTADIIKSMIEGKPFNYGSAIGEAVGTAITTGKVPLQYFASRQEVQYKSKQPGQEIPGGLQKQKQFFDILRTLGQVK